MKNNLLYKYTLYFNMHLYFIHLFERNIIFMGLRDHFDGFISVLIEGVGFNAHLSLPGIISKATDMCLHFNIMYVKGTCTKKIKRENKTKLTNATKSKFCLKTKNYEKLGKNTLLQNCSCIYGPILLLMFE